MRTKEIDNVGPKRIEHERWIETKIDRKNECSIKKQQ